MGNRCDDIFRTAIGGVLERAEETGASARSQDSTVVLFCRRRPAKVRVNAL